MASAPRAAAGLLDIHDAEAERVILGTVALAVDGAVDDCIAAGLEPLHFYSGWAARVWAKVCELYGDGLPTDGVAVFARLSAADRQGEEYARLVENPYANVTSRLALAQYVKSVRVAWMARRLYSAVTDVSLRLTAGDVRAETLAGMTEVLVAECDHVHAEASPARTLRQATLDAMLLAERRMREGATDVCYPSGIAGLDAIADGAQRGLLTVVGARPSVGKSVLLAQWALHAADKRAARVVYCSTENGEAKLVYRCLSYLSGVPVRICAGAVEPMEDDWNFVMTAADRLVGMKLDLWDANAPTVNQIAAHCRKKMKEWGGIDMLVVDFMQQCRAKAQNREREIGMISAGLAALAKDLNAAVVVASQLNREVEGRGDKGRPRLSDLRDSGSIEQDAYLAVLIHRPDKDGTKDMDGDLIVAKNKDGGLGMVPVSLVVNGLCFRERR